MGILVALTVGLVFWLAAWAFGMKAFDAFLVTIAVTLTAATARIMSPFLKQLMGREPAAPTELGPRER